MKSKLLTGLTLALTFCLSPALAKVPESEAAQLRNRLTPLGGERAGNAEGTVPEWRGGLTAPPPCASPGRRYCNPYENEQPLHVITAANLDQWTGNLSAGQTDMLLRYPQSYRIPVYRSHRTFANPGAVYEAAYRNAVNASLAPSGEAVREAGTAIPFPMPKLGVEAIWNHRLRYRGPGYSRWFSQAAVTPTGAINLIRLREDADFPYTAPDTMDDGVTQRWLHVALSPERLHGNLTLVWDTLDADRWPMSAWRLVPVEKRVRKLRGYGLDNPALLAEDLRVEDQLDGYFGSPGRYTWRLVDKRELVVPYNSYALHGGRNGLRDILAPAHLNPALARYEVHRVWVVEAALKPSATHRFKRRTFYIDEDSWQVLLVDLYDRQDRLVRWQEIHPIMLYDRAVLAPAVEVFYDLESSRYLVQGIDEGDPERTDVNFEEGHFTPGKVRAQVPRGS